MIDATTTTDRAAAAVRAMVRTRVRTMGEGLIMDAVLRVREGDGATAPDLDGYAERVAAATRGAHCLAASCREIAADYRAAAAALLAAAEGGRVDPHRLLAEEAFGLLGDREVCLLAIEAICETIASPRIYLGGMGGTQLSAALSARAALESDPSYARPWRILALLAEIPSLARDEAPEAEAPDAA